MWPRLHAPLQELAPFQSPLPQSRRRLQNWDPNMRSDYKILRTACENVSQVCKGQFLEAAGGGWGRLSISVFCFSVPETESVAAPGIACRGGGGPLPKTALSNHQHLPTAFATATNCRPPLCCSTTLAPAVPSAPSPFKQFLRCRRGDICVTNCSQQHCIFLHSRLGFPRTLRGFMQTHFLFLM